MNSMLSQPLLGLDKFRQDSQMPSRATVQEFTVIIGFPNSLIFCHSVLLTWSLLMAVMAQSINLGGQNIDGRRILLFSGDQHVCISL